VSTAEILVLGALPPEVRACLAGSFTLVDAGPAAGDLTRFRAAVTTSVAGADEAAMARLPNLRMLGCMGVGLDRIDLAAAARRGIAVRHTPDAVRTDTADGAIALLFATVRRVAEADRFVRAGRWGPSRMPPSRRVSGMRAGIVGLGHIGRLVAERLGGLGLELAYTGPRPKAAPWRFEPELADLAAWADALILCCAGGPATSGIVSAPVLAKLGPHGTLINVARGSVVDEAALLDALERGGLAGAGLDVFAEEPGLDPRFAALENVVLMPHYAAVTAQSRAEMGATLVAAFAELFVAP
jgi:hydroxypyruvate reductase